MLRLLEVFGYCIVGVLLMLILLCVVVSRFPPRPAAGRSTKSREKKKHHPNKKFEDARLFQHGKIKLHLLICYFYSKSLFTSGRRCCCVLVCRIHNIS